MKTQIMGEQKKAAVKIIQRIEEVRGRRNRI